MVSRSCWHNRFPLSAADSVVVVTPTMIVDHCISVNWILSVGGLFVRGRLCCNDNWLHSAIGNRQIAAKTGVQLAACTNLGQVSHEPWKSGGLVGCVCRNVMLEAGTECRRFQLLVLQENANPRA
ncbi:hypothetical protein TcWFU_005491 [Taenia crassiceps]|uniref:Uncharacterized protein n=1 Tax=Taenia crassiceps TaxID=6207 RepID=A0ABR4PYT3_9CEST